MPGVNPGVRGLTLTPEYRKNWENPEYASKGKQGVANRYPPLEETEQLKGKKFCA